MPEAVATTTGPCEGLAATAAAIAAGESTSREQVAAALERIAAAQPALNAFKCVREKAAREEAAEADRRLAAGERQPLLGVPVAIKDDMDLAGEPTAFGCDGEFEAKTQDGEVARRLRAAGAVIVGKTNTPEFGQWPWTEGSGFGATRNPWNVDHTPGGSSGGSAAAVAAGLVPAAVGSDGAGSVRIPAAWSHLVGVKPQRGRISTWPEPEAFNGLTCFGPLTRTVGDAAHLLDVLTGNRDGDLHRPPPPEVPFAEAAAREPGTLRIALSTKIPFSGLPARLDPEVRAAIERLGSLLGELGHEVFEADPAYGAVGFSFMPRSTAGVDAWREQTADQSLLDRRTHENARTGRILGGPLLRLARAAERPLRSRVGRIFNRADVVLAPTTATPPPRIGAAEGLSGWATDKAMVAAAPLAWPWNVLGWPGVNVPAGLTDAGLPVGAQLLGPANSEGLLLSLAAQLEDVERWHERRPPQM
ncbi:MAG: amidase [Solirubrobacterales bacterium]